MSNPGITGLVAYWKLDEVSGSRASQVNPTQMLLGDNFTVPSTTAFPRVFSSPRVANFNSVSTESLSLVDTYEFLSPLDDHLIIGLWICPHDVASGGHLVSKWGPGGMEYILEIIGNQIRFKVYDGIKDYTITATAFGNIYNGEWYFIQVYCYPGLETMGVAVNNVWNNTSSGPPNVDNGISAFFLGASGGSPVYYDGYMQDVFVYIGEMFTADEWSWLYHRGRIYEDISAPSAYPVIDVVTERILPDILVYDQDFVGLGLIDDYSSLNWAARYNEEGDFELELPITYMDSPLLAFGNFLRIVTSDKIMIIEEKKPTRSPTEGRLLVNGRSAESILRRRMQMQSHTWKTQAEYIAYHHVFYSVIGGGIPKRIIDLFEDGSGDTWPPTMEFSETVSEQFDTENIYDVVETVLKIVDLGFKIIVPNLQSPKLYFLVYDGVDRSDSVIFSDNFDNLLDASFLTTQKDKINTTQMVIDGDAVYERFFVWVGGSDEGAGGTEPEGLNRFEGRLATSIDRDTDGDDVDDLRDKEFLEIIQERGENVIKLNVALDIFDGNVDPRAPFVISEDYFLGDIVKINTLGHNAFARIVEVVRTYSVEGEKIYIAFDFEV